MARLRRFILVGWSLRTRFLRRSAARGGQSRNHPLQLRNQTQNARGYTENPARCLRFSQISITRHSTLLPPAPGTPARVRRARETKRGSPHGSRARQHTASLRAKLFCLHHPNRHLWDAPREGCACERADPPRGACFPSEQGLEHSLWYFDFRLVELAWDNANNRTGSSNHEKPHKSNAGQVRSEPVSASGATVISRLQFTTGAGYRRGRARPTRPMRSRRPPCHRRQRSRRALLPRG